MLRLIAGLFFAFILYVLLSANTGTPMFFEPLIRDIPFKDKIGHFTLVGLVSFFMNLLLKCRRYPMGERQLLLGSTLVVLFFTIEEASQYFLPTRTCDWADLFYNYLGIFIFGKLAIWFELKKSQLT